MPCPGRREEFVKFAAIWDLLKATFHRWSDVKAPRMGAALSYYTVFSLAPLLVLILAVAGLVFGREAARTQLVGGVEGTVGQPVAESIQGMIEHASNPFQGGLSAVISIVVLLFGASGVFGELQDSLNTVWSVEPKPGRGIWGIIQDRFLSFTLIVGSCFLMLVSLVLTAALNAISHLWTPDGQALLWLWHGLNAVVAFAVISGVFALMFKVLPDVKVAWKDVWIGAVLTALLFNLGKFLLGLYLAYGNVTSGFGAARSLVIILVWVYYSSQILIFGAAFTQVYTTRYGSGYRPDEKAQPLTAEAQANQGIGSRRDAPASALGPHR
jgi:membrane protein